MGEVRQEPSYLAIQYLHDTEQYPVSKLCAALHIPRCSYYKWRKREKNKNESLNEQTHRIHSRYDWPEIPCRRE